ncbi:MAG: hypothetical protein IBJ03_17495 [Gemmatimonadaceae bacterium]|nr:hypothetical protein [Gemmatimonadaceae bacterium]
MDVRVDESQQSQAQEFPGGRMVVEYEEPAVPVPVERPKASWPLRLLIGFFGLGTLTGMANSVYLAASGIGLFDGPTPLEPEWIPRILVRNSVYILSTGLITGLLYKRRRMGAITGLVGFMYPFLSSLYTGHPHWLSLGYLAFGLALIAAAWKELE